MQQYAHLPPDAEQPTWQGPREAIRIPNHPRANLLTDDQLAALNIYPADLAEIPEGARITSESWAIVSGRAVQTVAEYQTAEQLEAEAQAAEAARIAQEAVTDASAYHHDLGRLAAALSAFEGIEPGAGYVEIENLMAAQVAAAPPETIAQLTAASVTAMSVYSRLSRPEVGIDGARLWRALAALKGGGQ